MNPPDAHTGYGREHPVRLSARRSARPAPQKPDPPIGGEDVMTITSESLELNPKIDPELFNKPSSP